MVGLYLHNSWSDLLESDCVMGGWGMRDSTIHLLLTNVIISLPIWQFIECFYTIPLENGYFNVDLSSSRANAYHKVGGDNEAAATGNTEMILTDINN